MKISLFLIIVFSLFSGCSQSANNENKHTPKPAPGPSIANVHAELIGITENNSQNILSIKINEIIALGTATPSVNIDDTINIKLPNKAEAISNLNEKIKSNNMRELKIKATNVGNEVFWSIVDIK